tara:strand:+ start:550 stop:756 length:207 start_codon:yes stop_codon:yes gene_type:complete
MRNPKTIQTDSRIFQIITFEGETILCNLKHLKLKDLKEIKTLRHLWNGKFESFGKIDLKEMILTRNKK